MPAERIVSGQSATPQEEALNQSLRPTRLEGYVGQPRLVEKLRIALAAVARRGEPMEHVLLHGPPGLGKTTLAHIIASEMGTRLVVTSGPAMPRPTDLVGTLTKLAHRDVLFIDESHRLSPVVEEYLYPAMEDFKIDVTLDQGMHAKPITLPIKPFTLIGATTRAGLLSGPMRSRFGLTHNLDFYSEQELLTILTRSAGLLGLTSSGAAPERGAGDGAEPEPAPGAEGEARPEPEPRALAAALRAIAARSRGTPRVANRLLRRARDFAQVRADGRLTPQTVDAALRLEGVDQLGLDELDRRYMRVIGEVYQGGPVGLEAVAATLSEDAGTLEEMVEPYLLQIGFLARTRRGRELTRAGAEHVGLKLPASTRREGEQSLFDE